MAGAIFGEVHMSLSMAGEAFGEIWNGNLGCEAGCGLTVSFIVQTQEILRLPRKMNLMIDS